MQTETEALVAISRELSPAAVIAAISGVLLAFSRSAPMLAKLWGHLPKPLPAVIPSLVTLIPSALDVLQKNTDLTWGGVTMSLLVALGILATGWLEAAHPKSKEDPKRDDGPPSEKPVGPWVDIDARTAPPTPSLPRLAKFIAVGWMLVACSSATANHPACTPAALQDAKNAYKLDVHTQCAAYDVLEECPDYPRLKSDFDKRVNAGCGQ